MKVHCVTALFAVFLLGVGAGLSLRPAPEPPRVVRVPVYVAHTSIALGPITGAVLGGLEHWQSDRYGQYVVEGSHNAP